MQLNTQNHESIFTEKVLIAKLMHHKFLYSPFIQNIEESKALRVHSKFHWYKLLNDDTRNCYNHLFLIWKWQIMGF